MLTELEKRKNEKIAVVLTKLHELEEVPLRNYNMVRRQVMKEGNAGRMKTARI